MQSMLNVTNLLTRYIYLGVFTCIYVISSDPIPAYFDTVSAWGWIKSINAR